MKRYYFINIFILHSNYVRRKMYVGPCLFTKFFIVKLAAKTKPIILCYVTFLLSELPKLLVVFNFWKD